MDCPFHKGYFLDRNDVGDKGFCGQCMEWYEIPSDHFIYYNQSDFWIWMGIIIFWFILTMTVSWGYL